MIFRSLKMRVTSFSGVDSVITTTSLTMTSDATRLIRPPGFYDQVTTVIGTGIKQSIKMISPNIATRMRAGPSFSYSSLTGG